MVCRDDVVTTYLFQEFKTLPSSYQNANLVPSERLGYGRSSIRMSKLNATK